MNTDEPTYYCAACLSPLLLHLEETYCDSCGKAIERDSDALDEAAMDRIRKLDDEALIAAIRDGLIGGRG